MTLCQDKQEGKRIKDNGYGICNNIMKRANRAISKTYFSNYSDYPLASSFTLILKAIFISASVEMFKIVNQFFTIGMKRIFSG